MLRRTLRALFPKVARRRLTFRGGIFALPVFLVLQLLYPISLQQAEWVETSAQLTVLAVWAIVLNLLVTAQNAYAPGVFIFAPIG